ncbi:pentatricopeptide repeat-containing protein At3g09040, mitochondrial isoform X1 [Primulina huaijiensis]|uniref:pentatricopeptide repeat-containing protein At3g09040, mitochondrial isoform X1 n=1 Tax=Primulina huaijiensis TaxID=1492673 RepID=UPI003CC6E26F
MPLSFRVKVQYLKPNFYSLNQQRKFLTTQLVQDPHLQRSPAEESPLRNYLLKLCLEQCKKIQGRQAFDGMPERISSLKTGKAIHAKSLKFCISVEGELGNAILDLYAKCGRADYALEVFSHLNERDEFAWNSIMFMHSRKGLCRGVLEDFRSMRSCGLVGNRFTFATVLSSCAKLTDMELGKQVHCEVFKMGLESDAYCEGALIDMYAKCGNLFWARSIFDNVLDPDMVSWTALISGYAQVGLTEEAIEIFMKMQRVGRKLDQVVFVTVLNAYVGQGRLEDAWNLFSQMPNPNVVACNVMISGHAKGGHEGEAIKIFKHMMQSGVKPTRSTLGSVFSAIASVTNYEYGSQVHAQAVKQGLYCNIYAGSSLINMYAKCKHMESAHAVFDELKDKNDVIWNTLLRGYAQNGDALEVLKLFTNMRISGFQPDEYTYTSILSACAYLENMVMGCQLHSIIVKNMYGLNLYVGNALVDMYAKYGALPDARKQFELLSNRDQVSWNAIIVGYVRDEQEEEAFYLFRRMLSEGIEPDEVSMASILSAAANLQDLAKGRQVHCFLVKYGLEEGLYSGSSLIDMYCKCGIVAAASEVFSCMPQISVVCVNTLISGHARVNIVAAVTIFKSMLAEGLQPSEITFATLLEACSDNTYLPFGLQIHCSVLKLGLSFYDEFLVVSLLGMYMHAQAITDAIKLFSELPYPKSTVMWTVLISGSTDNDYGEEALRWYQEMRIHNVMPDQATFASVLRACSVLASLEEGRKIHSIIFHIGYDEDEVTGSALVDMYAKCGDVKSSALVFVAMVIKKDIISWNSMIVGYAKNGFAQNALKIFDEMKQENVKPDEITFLGVLTACSHAGMVSEGQELYNSMINHYGVRPRVDHCACMIDLFGRWGFLTEAENFINSLDFEPDSMIWATYLNTCRLHGDDIRGQRAAEKLIHLEPQDSSPYVLLSNMYAASGNWEGVNFVRKKMNERGVHKFPGCSWIVVEQKTNYFVSGDKFHPNAGEIITLLKDLATLMKDEGHASDSIYIGLNEVRDCNLSLLIGKGTEIALCI